MVNQNYDFSSDQEVDLNQPDNIPPLPPLDESMLDNNSSDFFQNLDNLDDYAADNAIPSSQNVPDVPDHILESSAATMIPDTDLKLNEFSLFLNEKYDDLNELAKVKNPDAPLIGHDSAFEKNIQSQWFVEYNKIKAESGEKEKMLLCKSNGHFYSDKDTPESALKDYGFDDDEVKKLAPHMDFTFIGNTEIKGNKGKGLQRGQFKTFVLTLKDPSSAASADALATIVAQKTKHVQSHIDNTYNLDKAKDKILSRVEGLVQAETAQTGVKPFVGVGPALFLNNRAVYEKLSEIPEIKDKFKIEPLDVNGNKITYTGFSEGLNSYFNAELRLHKVTTKDPDSLPQSELENLISEHLKDEKEPLLIVPEHDDNKIIDKQHDKILGNNNPDENIKIKEGIPAKEKNNSPDGVELVTNKQKFNNPQNSKSQSGDDEDEEKRKKRKRESDDKRVSVGEIALRAVQKLAEKTLKALLRIVQMIAMALLAIIQSLLALGNRGMTKAFGTKPYFEHPNLLKTFEKNDFISNLFEKKNDGPANKNDKELTEKNDIRDALDGVFKDKKASEPELADEFTKNSLKQQMAVIGAPSELDLLKEAALKAENLSDGVKDQLNAQAEQEVSTLSDDAKKEMLASLSIPAAHQFGEDLTSKVAPTLMYDEAHGVLLAKGDEVQLEDGTTAGVLSAYDVGGSLYYAVANESDDKNYNLSYVEASALTLLGHNKVSFDNESNLVEQANNAVIERYQQDHEGKIQNIEILNYDSPQENSISVEELANKIQLITNATNSDLKSINFQDEFENSNLKKRFDEKLIYQLHHDKTPTLATNPLHGQRHPLFGKLLDLNDAVEAKLPQSGMMIEGTVMGAYIHGDQLYYSLATDKNTYNLPAGDITLTEVNGGQINDSSIQAHLNTQKWTENISREHKHGAEPLILTHSLASEEFNKKHSIDVGAWVKTEPTAMLGDVGVKPLLKNDQNEFIGANNIYSVMEDGKKRSFVSIGQTVDESTGQKHSLVLEVNKNAFALNSYIPLQPSKTTLKSLDMDNPSVILEKEGGVDHLSSVIDKTRDMYESGSNKVKASLINRLSDQINGKQNTNEQAQSFYKDKAIASALLAENAAKAFNIENPHILGLEANLGQTQINDQQLTQSLNHPESQKILSDNAQLNNSHYKPNQLLPNEVIFNKPDSSFDSLDNLMPTHHSNSQPSFKDLGQNFVSLNGASLIEQAAKNTSVLINEEAAHLIPDQNIEAPERLGSELVKQVSTINSELPESVLMRVALTYVTGDRLCTNQEGGIDLLNAKESLIKEREKINQDIIQLMPKIEPYLEGVSADGRIENISAVKINDFEGLKKLLNEDPEVKLRLSTIMNKESVLTSSVENHLDKVESRLEKIHGKLDLRKFDMDNIKTLNSVSTAFLDTVKDDFEKTKSVTDLVSILKEIKNANGDLSYSDIAIKVVNDNVKYSNSFTDHLSSMHSSFKPNTTHQIIDQAPKQDNDKSLSFNH